MPRYTRYATPIHLTMVNANTDVASTAATPAIDAAPHASWPVLQPAAAAMADRRPRMTALRTTTAVSGPGTTVASQATPANVSRVVSTIDTLAIRQEATNRVHIMGGST